MSLHFNQVIFNQSEMSYEKCYYMVAYRIQNHHRIGLLAKARNEWENRANRRYLFKRNSILVPDFSLFYARGASVRKLLVHRRWSEIAPLSYATSSRRHLHSHVSIICEKTFFSQFSAYLSVKLIIIHRPINRVHFVNFSNMTYNLVSIAVIFNLTRSS